MSIILKAKSCDYHLRLFYSIKYGYISCQTVVLGARIIAMQHPILHMTSAVGGCYTQRHIHTMQLP